VKLITAVTDPATFDVIKDALALFGVRGMTVGQVYRASRRTSHTQIYRGRQFSTDLQPSLRIELVVPNDEVLDLIHVIQTILSTADREDSAAWSSPIDLVVRVRTSEHGIDAL
jgi:nitrogen regulatory protein P-II 1